MPLHYFAKLLAPFLLFIFASSMILPIVYITEYGMVV